jgi:hypothetical protein
MVVSVAASDSATAFMDKLLIELRISSIIDPWRKSC